MRAPLIRPTSLTCGARVLAVVAVVVAILTVPGVVRASAAPLTGCASTDYPVGMDVNDSSGSITWANVTCVDFVYAEATDGTSYSDPSFADNRSGASSRSLPFGAYDFFEPNENAVTQADDFLAADTVHPGDLPPMIDLEVTDSESASTIISGVTSWLSTVTAATGLAPIIYTSNSFWNTTLGDPDQFSGDPLWITQPGANLPTVPDSNWGGHSWTLWQYSLSGFVTGVPNEVDLDYYNGTSVGALASSTASDVTIASLSKGVVAGGSVTVGVRVAGAFTGSAVPAPTGSVTVDVGSHECGATLSGKGGVATGSCSVPVADAGDVPVTASYAGDTNWQSGATSSPSSATVGKASPTATLALSKSKIAVGAEHAERLTVTVAAAHGPTITGGSVKIVAGSRTLCHVSLTSSHVACTLSARQLPAGTYEVRASYSGSANLNAATSNKVKLLVET